MIARVIIRPDAAVDIERARACYDDQRPGLGGQFVADLDATLERVKSIPEVYAPVLGTVRRCKLGRFPYLMFCRIVELRIEILGVFHASRNPTVWRSRVRRDT